MIYGECDLCGALGPVIDFERDILDEPTAWRCWPHCNDDDDDYYDDDDE